MEGVGGAKSVTQATTVSQGPEQEKLVMATGRQDGEVARSTLLAKAVMPVPEVPAQQGVEKESGKG